MSKTNKQLEKQLDLCIQEQHLTVIGRFKEGLRTIDLLTGNVREHLEHAPTTPETEAAIAIVDAIAEQIKTMVD